MRYTSAPTLAHMQQRITDIAEDARERVADAALIATESADRIRSVSIGYVQRAPLQALAIAVVIGVLCGLALGRRSEKREEEN
jgi:ElaB/YqjD/DUF883 family membrane-anchored ribosome-binding protein